MIDFRYKRVCVTGGAGFLGRVVCARLRERGVRSVFVPRSAEFDLTDARQASAMLDAARPDLVIHLAADVGGIGANREHPGRFFYANMAMGLNLIEAARIRGVEKFVQVGSVCSYPKHCPVPFKESDLWNGYPEETNAPYGVAKRALSVMIDGYRREYGFNGIYLVPVNLYGPGDNFRLDTSHVVPAMIRTFCEAVDQGRDSVTCWGSGSCTREFLYLDDAAEAIVIAAATVEDSLPINLGSGEEVSIQGLAEMIAKRCDFHGTIHWDTARPDGQPRRRLDTSQAARRFGWRAQTRLEQGLVRTIQWWRDHAPNDLSPAAIGPTIS